METVTLFGLLNRPYAGYQVCQPHLVWNPLPANYAFGTRSLLGGAIIFYIGETGNMVTRPMPPNHERWLEALRFGATHIFARVNQMGEDERKREEADLIAAYNPPMNVQKPLLQRSPQLGALAALARAGHGKKR